MIRGCIFDLDGTLFRGNSVLPHAVEVVAELRRRGTLVRFLTNNSGDTRDRYMQKLGGMGFQPRADEIYSSAIGTAAYCASVGVRSVFVVGEPGLRETLAGAEISVDSPTADAVVAGICRGLTYDWINSAMQQIRAGARFIATNTDATYPLEEGRVVPGAGITVAAIRTCSGVEPYVVGKPNPYLVELIIRDAGLSPHETLVVGDRYETDIVSGQAAGCPVLMVLTGVTSEAPEGVPSAPDVRRVLEIVGS